jgi:hypothetical protein
LTVRPFVQDNESTSRDWRWIELGYPEPSNIISVLRILIKGIIAFSVSSVDGAMRCGAIYKKDL